MEGSIAGLARPGNTTATRSPVPSRESKKADPLFVEIANLLSQMFGNGAPMAFRVAGLAIGLKDALFEIMDGDGVLRPSKSDWLFRNLIKKTLASLLLGSKGYSDYIGDKFLDFLFGNQDEELDKKDGITLSGLVSRLKAYLPYIATLNARQDGSVWALMRGEFAYVDFDKMGKIAEGWDFNKIDKGIIGAAVKGYILSKANSRMDQTRVEKELSEKLGNPPDFNKIKKELAALVICAAHAEINSYYAQHKDDGMKYDIDFNKEVFDKDKLLEQYANGVMRKWLEKKELPKVLDRESIAKTYEEYSTQKHAPGEARPTAVSKNSP